MLWGTAGPYAPYFRVVKFIVQRDIKSTKFYVEEVVLWRTINLGRPVIALTSKCEAGIMFN
jgi:hypothetical protein